MATVSIMRSASRPAAPIYLGGSGGVTLVSTNQASVAVQAGDIRLPSATSFAAASRDAADASATAGCTTRNFGVTSQSATGASSGGHRLATPLTVGAGGPQLVTIVSGVAMSPSSPPAWQEPFVAVPSLAGIAAPSTTASAASAPVVGGWN